MNNLKKKKIILAVCIILIFIPLASFSEISVNSNEYYINKKQSLKSTNGKFYAYIVLLFNENPHFVNIIQMGTIPLKEISVEGFNVKAYRNYLNTIRNTPLYKDAEIILKVFIEPQSFNEKSLKVIEDRLTERKIILKFYKESGHNRSGISLDYCIYGDKKKIDFTHPILKSGGDVFIINPYIYYDEFSTSNSTFYHDMIYIDHEEVRNDVIIASNIMKGKEIKSLFYVGSRVTDDIKYCILKAFEGGKNIKNDIWKIFVIHELTHKIINNSYNSFDQVTGEEISMSSSIYSNPYLGLSTMYSYLNYSKFNPHRIAALNYIQFLSKKLKNTKYVNNPGLIKFINSEVIKKISFEHVNSCLDSFNKK